MSIFMWLGASIFLTPIIFTGGSLISNIRRECGIVAMLTTIVFLPLSIKMVIVVFNYTAYSMKSISLGEEVKLFDMFTDIDKYCALVLVACVFVFHISSWIHRKKHSDIQ